MSTMPLPLRVLLSHREFSEHTLRRRVLLSQLPLAIATALVVLVDVLFARGRVTADPWFELGLALVAVLTLAAGTIPWNRSPTGTYWVIPLLDLVAIMFLAAGAYPTLTGLPMLAMIPVFWMAWSGLHPRTTVAVGFCATLLIAWSQYWHEGMEMSWTDLGRPLVMPIIVMSVAATANLAVQSMMATDRKLTQILADSRIQADLLDAVLNAASVGVVAVDRNGHTFLTNDTQRQRHAAGAPEGTGDPTEAELLIFGAGRRRERETTALHERERPVYRAMHGEEFTDQLVWIGPAESAEAVAVSARRLTDERGEFNGSVIVFQGVTELIQASQAKDRFLASVSHELRTPLTSILGYLEVLQDLRALPSSAEQPLAIAERNARRLLHLVNDLLTAGTSSMHLRLQPTDLATIVRESVSGQQQTAHIAGLHVHLKVPDALPLRADPDRLGQVIDNLVSNAIKYTPSGGHVTVEVGAEDEAAVVSVTDTGVGMASAEVEQLFTRFYRAESARSSGIPGTGLGLAIARELAEAHGGSLAVQSVPGKGSTFTVRVPIHR